MDPSLQATLAVFTVLCSGVVSATVTYKLSDRRAARDFRRSKLEECFECFDRFTTQLTVNSLPILQVMKDEISWDDANDMLAERVKDSDSKNLLKIEMLTHLYFPELIESYESLISVRDDLAALRAKAKRAYLDQADQAKVLDLYYKAYKDLDVVENAFKKRLFTLVPA